MDQPSPPTGAPTAGLGLRELTALLALSMSLTALGIDIMLPAFTEIRADLGLAEGSTAVTGLVTAYFLGLAVGQLGYGPVADRYGRKRVLYVGYAVYGVGALLAALAPNLGLVLVSRFVWGLGAAGPRVAAMAIVRDNFQGDRMARTMSSIMAVFILVPIIAPLVGAGIVSVVSWRWLFVLCALGAALLAAWAGRLRETLRPEHRIDELRFGPVLRSARAVFANRFTVAYMLAMTSLYGVFTSYIGSSEVILTETFDQGDAFPFVFGGLASVMGLAMLTNGRIVERVGIRPLGHTALVTYLVLAGVFLAVALSQGGRPPLLVFLVGMAVLLASHSFLIPNLNAIAMDPMAGVAGTAASVIGAIQVAGGALLGAVLDQAYDGTILPLCIGFFGCGAAALALVLWAERGRLALLRR